VWGFASTIVLTTLLAGSQALGLTRMNIPYLLGTMTTANRDRATWTGAAVHVLNGWLFALIYIATFEVWGGATWWRGAAIGVVHAAFVLTVGMSILPSVHPRMASEHAGPEARRQLEPPGMFALNYGVRTPISVIVAHVVYGAILGALYRVH